MNNSIKLRCGSCGRSFIRSKSKYIFDIKRAKHRFFCRRICANKGHSKLMGISNVSKNPYTAYKISKGVRRWHANIDSRTRERISAKISVSKSKPKIKICIFCHEAFRYKHNKQRCCSTACSNKMSWEKGIYKNIGIKASIRLKKLFREHPEKHPNMYVANNKLRTTTEEPIKEIIEKLGFIFNQDFYHNFHIQTLSGNRWADFAFPKLKIDIECDGTYWHRHPLKDAERDKELKEIGWRTLRLTEMKIQKFPVLCEQILSKVLKE